MNGKWVTRTKLINDFLTGRMPNKMKVYYLSIDRYENDHNKKIRPTN